MWERERERGKERERRKEREREREKKRKREIKYATERDEYNWLTAINFFTIIIKSIFYDNY